MGWLLQTGSAVTRWSEWPASHETNGMITHICKYQSLISYKWVCTCSIHHSHAVPLVLISWGWGHLSVSWYTIVCFIFSGIQLLQPFPLDTNPVIIAMQMIGGLNTILLKAGTNFLTDNRAKHSSVISIWKSNDGVDFTPFDLSLNKGKKIIGSWHDLGKKNEMKMTRRSWAFYREYLDFFIGPD